MADAAERDRLKAATRAVKAELEDYPEVRQLAGHIAALALQAADKAEGVPDDASTAATHYTPEEHDQPECDADVDADPETVMFGTLNPRKVTCPDCLAAMDPEPAPKEG
jgi:hypothetical protein